MKSKIKPLLGKIENEKETEGKDDAGDKDDMTCARDRSVASPDDTNDVASPDDANDVASDDVTYDDDDDTWEVDAEPPAASSAAAVAAAVAIAAASAADPTAAPGVETNGCAIDLAFALAVDSCAMESQELVTEET